MTINDYVGFVGDQVRYRIAGDDEPVDDRWFGGRGYDLILSARGMMKQASTANGVFTARVTQESWNTPLPGLGVVRPFFAMHQPCPGRLLSEAVSFLCDPTVQEERVVQFVYTEDVWSVHYPEQSASVGSVTFDATHPDVCIEIHKHPGTAAYFSGADNEDELGLKVYGVLANVTEPGEPVLRLRVGVYGRWLYVRANSVFDGVSGITEVMPAIVRQKELVPGPLDVFLRRFLGSFR